MPRKDLAVEQRLYDGAVTLWVMPYVSAMNNIVQHKFERIVPREEWTWLEKAFVMIEANVVDAAFADGDVPLPARMWRAYWQSRNGDPDHNWEAFVGIAAPEMTDPFWDALSSAQASSATQASPALRNPGDDADPNDDSATKKRVRTS